MEETSTDSFHQLIIDDGAGESLTSSPSHQKNILEPDLFLEPESGNEVLCTSWSAMNVDTSISNNQDVNFSAEVEVSDASAEGVLLARRSIQGNLQFARDLSRDRQDSSLGGDKPNRSGGTTSLSLQGGERVAASSSAQALLLQSFSSGIMSERGGSHSHPLFTSLQSDNGSTWSARGSATAPSGTGNRFHNRGTTTSVWSAQAGLTGTGNAAASSALSGSLLHQSRLEHHNEVVKEVNWTVDQESKGAICLKEALDKFTEHFAALTYSSSLSAPSKSISQVKAKEASSGTSTSDSVSNQSSGGDETSGNDSSLVSESEDVKDHFDEGMEFHKSLIKLKEHSHQAEGQSCYCEFGRIRPSCQVERDLSYAILLFNIGKCKERLGQHAEAKTSYGESERHLIAACEHVDLKAWHHRRDIDCVKQALLISKGQLFYLEKDYENALIVLEGALNLTDSSDALQGDRETRIALRNCIGVVQYAKTAQEMPAEESDSLLNEAQKNFENSSAYYTEEIGIPACTVEQKLAYATVLNNLGRVFLVKNSFNDAMQQFETAYEVRKIHLGLAHMDTFVISCSIGHTAEQLNQDEVSEKWYNLFLESTKQWIDLARAKNLDGENIFNEAIYLANKFLGGLLKKRGDLESARQHYCKALQAAESSFGPRHRLIPILWHSIGHCWYGLGQWAESMRHYERGLEIHLEHETEPICFMKSYEDIGMSCFQKAKELLYAQDDADTADDTKHYFELALEWFEKWWNVQKPELEENPDLFHPESLYEPLLSMSETYYNLHNVEKGKEFMSTWLATHNKTEAESQLDWGCTLSEAGQVLFDVPAYGTMGSRSALQYFVASKHYLNLARVSDDDNLRSRQITCILSNFYYLSVIFENGGDYIEAIRYLKQWKETQDQEKGRNVDTDVYFMNRIAHLCVEIGDTEEAEKYYRELLGARVRILDQYRDELTQVDASELDEYHRMIVETNIVLSELLYQTGKYDPALAELQNALQVLLRISNVTQEDRLHSYLIFRYIGDVHYAERDNDKAMVAYAEAETYASSVTPNILKQRKRKWFEVKQQWCHLAGAA